MPEPIRCWTMTDPAYNAYHDEEWELGMADRAAHLPSSLAELQERLSAQ